MSTSSLVESLANAGPFHPFPMRRGEDQRMPKILRAMKWTFAIVHFIARRIFGKRWSIPPIPNDSTSDEVDDGECPLLFQSIKHRTICRQCEIQTKGDIRHRPLH